MHKTRMRMMPSSTPIQARKKYPSVSLENSRNFVSFAVFSFLIFSRSAAAPSSEVSVVLPSAWRDEPETCTLLCSTLARVCCAVPATTFAAEYSGLLALRSQSNLPFIMRWSCLLWLFEKSPTWLSSMDSFNRLLSSLSDLTSGWLLSAIKGECLTRGASDVCSALSPSTVWRAAACATVCCCAAAGILERPCRIDFLASSSFCSSCTSGSTFADTEASRHATATSSAANRMFRPPMR
mmetsp:Transcript_46637/g.75106  ORF Transcript_46637/g.75106 Transcript_46637/m.75106 type:complete len:238 (-) Transcript_46637:8-721(-)